MQHHFLFNVLVVALTNTCASFKTPAPLWRIKNMETSDTFSGMMSNTMSHSVSPSSSSRLYSNSKHNVETKKGEAVLHTGLKGSVRAVIKSWNYADDEVVVRTLKGGITNLLYTLTPKKNDEETVIVRIYGEGTSLFVDRAVENIVFSSLSDRGIGPKFYGTFNNGRVEGFLDAKTLTPEEMRDRPVYPRTSTAIARLHAQTIKEISQSPLLWTKMDSFFDLAERDLTSSTEEKEEKEGKEKKSSKPCKCDFNLKEMRDESLWLREDLDRTKSKLIAKSKTATNRMEKRRIEGGIFGFEVVLCHNDLLAGNILIYNNVTNIPSLPAEQVESNNNSTQYSVEEKTNGNWSLEEQSSSAVRTNAMRTVHTNIDEERNENQHKENVLTDVRTDTRTAVHTIPEERADTEGVTLIDFEYAGCNYRAWDIANHFNEFAGFDFNIKEDFPSFEMRTEFLSHYVRGVYENDSESKSFLSSIVSDPEELQYFSEGLEVSSAPIIIDLNPTLFMCVINSTITALE